MAGWRLLLTGGDGALPECEAVLHTPGSAPVVLLDSSFDYGARPRFGDRHVIDENLAPGAYQLDVRVAGYRPVTRSIDVRSGEVTEIPIRLERE